MKVPLTKELLLHLKEEQYTYLVAENQAQQQWYVFKPVDWNEEAFSNECLTNDFDDHMILNIDSALDVFMYEDYLNHEVILP